MASNINRVIITGNLTRDPETKTFGEGSLTKLRVAVNTRRKEGGEWVDKPNYFDVTVFGRQGESAAQYLAKGRPVAIDGRLSWREWETDDGSKRQAVEIIADNVQFLSAKGDDSSPVNKAEALPQSDVPADTAGLAAGQSAKAKDDDIPF